MIASQVARFVPHQAPLGRSLTVPLLAMLFVVSVATGLVAGGGIDNMDFAVKCALVLAGGIFAVTLVTHRPVLFPLSAYLFAIPFDNVLQTGAGTVTKFLGVAAVVVVLLVMLDRRRTVTAPLALLVWGGFLVWSVATLMWSRDPGFGLPNLIQVGQLYALFAVIAVLRIRPSEVRILAIAVVAGGVACACYGLWLYTHGGFVVNGIATQRLNIMLGANSFINADHFSGALVLPVGLALVGSLHLRGWAKAAAIASLLLLLGGLFVSASRGSVVAVGVMWLYLLVFYRHRAQLAAVAVAALLASIPLPSVWLRFIDPTQGEAGGRYGIWKIAWAAFQQHWLAGIGTGQFRIAYGDVFLDVYSKGSFHPWAEDSHNLIASSAVELGIIGLAIILLAWVVQFRVTRCVPPTSSLYHLRIALEASTIGLFLVAMTADVMWYKYLWIAFIMGVLIRNAWICERESAGQLT
jgi:O-antigen ligase